MGSDSDEDDEYDGCEETSLEAYTTPLDEDDCDVDEYNIFKQVLGGLRGSNPAWYGQPTGHLTEVQQKALGEVVTFADQRCAAKESKKIAGWRIPIRPADSSWGIQLWLT